MSGKDPKKDPTKIPEKYRVSGWLIFALLLAIAYALFSFLVVNKELAYDTRTVSSLPERYKVMPADISRSTIRTEIIRRPAPPQRNNIIGIAPWNAWVRIDHGDHGRYNVIVYTQTIFDKPVEVEEFSAQISLVGDEKQILPGVAFSQTGPGEYTAAVTLPDNGEWEVRGRFKKGLEVILIAQKIKPLMPK